MITVEKTVFISYRRTNASWALAIYQDLTHNGWDVFFDFKGVSSGDFESAILENVRTRAHFLVLLTPSALRRCSNAEDWLRREIETAIEAKRNIVPIMLPGFRFASPAIARQLTGELQKLRRYNALNVPVDYFTEAMKRLREGFLNKPSAPASLPATSQAQRAARVQQAAAGKAPAAQAKELAGEECFEQGLSATNRDDKISIYAEAIALKPGLAEAVLDFEGKKGRNVNAEQVGFVVGPATERKKTVGVSHSRLPKTGSATSGKGRTPRESTQRKKNEAGKLKKAALIRAQKPTGAKPSRQALGRRPALPNAAGDNNLKRVRYQPLSGMVKGNIKKPTPITKWLKNLLG